MASINFDATQVAPNAGISPVEPGKYPVFITKSEFKPTANGAGKILEIHCMINGGNNHGKSIMFNLNWENQSAKAVEIGRGRFSAICHAVGVLHVQDTQQLHNIIFELEVAVTPDGKYNDVIAINPVSQQPQAQQAAPVMQPQYQQPPANVMPMQPQAQAQPVYQQPVMQPQAQPQVDPMAAYTNMAQPVQPQQPQAQAQPQVPDWILNQQRAAAAAQAQPMGNG